MNTFTTTLGLMPTREHDARGCFCAPTKPTLADDLGNALWQVIVFAIIPGFIIAALWQNQTQKLQYIAAQSQRIEQPALQDTKQYDMWHSLPDTPMQTPDGFVVSLSNYSHGGEHETEKQGR